MTFNIALVSVVAAAFTASISIDSRILSLLRTTDTEAWSELRLERAMCICLPRTLPYCIFVEDTNCKGLMRLMPLQLMSEALNTHETMDISSLDTHSLFGQLINDRSFPRTNRSDVQPQLSQFARDEQYGAKQERDGSS